ncbi:MAG: prfB [Candidatus Saccharibacteria bacterium]|nr:prfB [Candidatus Saccharibacteria bacterium]
MHDLHKQADQLHHELNQALGRLNFGPLDEEEKSLNHLMAQPDFWQDAQHAAEVSKQQAKLEKRLQPWRQLRQELADTKELLSLNDDSLQSDLSKTLEKLNTRFVQLQDDLKLTGPYDDYDAVLSIHAGAGGTDAQDWAQMIMRMYLRFAEQQGWKADVLEESSSDEAGIKSVTIEMTGDYTYGRLKSEHGVHRLVRLSPFNSDNLRQTSFAKVEVTPKIDRPDQLVIDDKDLKIDVYRSGGHGGQSVNTTDSAVRITHLPTGLVVAIQNERSQLQNKETALSILRGRLAQLQLEQHAEQLSELKGPNEQAAWGNQIRSYVLHPYKQVKDLRTRHESSDPDKVLDGDLEPFIEAYLNQIDIE